MKAVVLRGNEQLSYEDITTPEVTKGAVRIKVAVCGICGSDIPRVYDHAAHNYPIVLGHEFSGVIDAVGEGVEELKVGDHVVAAPLIPCHKCQNCLAGNYSLCTQYSFIGSRQQGAMADYVVTPEKNVVKISDNISFEHAAAIEPSTVALHALRIANMVEGKSVAVVGCGIIGLFAIQWAKLLGASSVAAIGRGQAGLDAAKEAGADACFSTKIGTEALLKELNPQGYDYVIECSGVTETIHLSFRIVAKKGTVCFIGTPKDELTFSVSLWEQINRKECWITGSWMSYSSPFPGEEWTLSAKYLETGELKIVPGMIHGVYPMSKAKEAFDIIREGHSKGRVLLSTEVNG